MALPYGVKREKTLDIIVHNFGVDAYYDSVLWQKKAVKNHFQKYPEYHYHYVILTNGEILKGNPEDVVVWHANNNEVNDTSVSLCLWGNLSKRKPTEAQIRSLIALLKKLTKKYKIPVKNILGHRDVGDDWTECPGDYLYQMLPQIRKEVESMGIPQWKIDAVNKAKEKGWIISDHTPDEPVDMGTLCAILLNIEKVNNVSLINLAETLAHTILNELKKNGGL